MDPVSLFLLLIAAIFLIGVAGELIFERTGVPDVVWLLGVGLLLGPAFGVADRETLAAIAPYFGAVTLVIVLFDGGSELRLAEASRAVPRATVMAATGFVLAAGSIAAASMAASAAGWLPASWTWLHGVTLGAILGGSSSIVIMPALRRMALPPAVSNMVSLESAMTDVLCVVVAAACIRLSVSGSTDLVAAAATLGRAFGIGLGGGLLVGLLALLTLKRLRHSTHAYPLILGTLLITYVAIDELGGSAALGILVVAVLVGNAPALSDAVGLVRGARLGRGVTDTHDQLAFIVKSFFFTFMGAMLGPPWGLVALGGLFGLLLVAARVPAVFVGTLGAGLGHAEKGVVTMLLPRGMAAGVLAILPAQQGMVDTAELPVVVFATVLTTILLFAVGTSVFRRRLPVPPPEASERGQAAETPVEAPAAEAPSGRQAT
jgi:cell volume regulation protein A